MKTYKKIKLDRDTAERCVPNFKSIIVGVDGINVCNN